MKHCANHTHSVTAVVGIAASKAFEFLSDPIALGEWSLGCMDTKPAGRHGLFRGRSMFSKADCWFSLDPHPDLLLVDYRTGLPDKLELFISARAIPAGDQTGPKPQCYVTLAAWRTVEMSDERWKMLCASHEAEIWLIKTQMESLASEGS